MHTFLAGLFGGYWVFGHGRGATSSVNQQIVIYVFARVVLALAKLAVQPPGPNALVGSSYGQHGGKGVIGLTEDQLLAIQRYSWPVFASLSWASVMWLFRWYPEMLQPSLRSSITYMYVSLLLLFLLERIVRLITGGLTSGVSFVDTRMLRSGMARGITCYITNSTRVDDACKPDICVSSVALILDDLGLASDLYIQSVHISLTPSFFFCSFANSNHWHDFWSYVMQYKQPALPGMPAKVD